jgi:TM2 domain/zinc-ribbon domain
MITALRDEPFSNNGCARGPEVMRPNYCPRCGHELAADQRYCSQCALPIAPDERVYDDFEVSPRSRLVALVLCVLLGFLGVHRFYVDRIGSGVVWLLTGGVFGIGWLIDIVRIAAGDFRDREGLPLLEWD